MAALTMADDLIETRKRIGTLESEIAALRSVVSAATARSEASDKQLADALTRTAERMERVTDSLAEPRGRQDFG
jgi:cell division protein ZapA